MEIQVDAVPDLPQIIVFNVAGIDRARRNPELIGLAAIFRQNLLLLLLAPVQVRPFPPCLMNRRRISCGVPDDACHMKAFHIMGKMCRSDVNISVRIGQRVHPRSTGEGIGARLHFPADILPFPLVPVRHVRKALHLLCVCKTWPEKAILIQLPAPSAGPAGQLRSLRRHLILCAAGTALVEHLVQSLRSARIGDPAVILLLPAEIIILEGIPDPVGDLLGIQLSHFLRTQNAFHLGAGVPDAVIGQMIKRRIDMMAVTHQDHHRYLQGPDQLAQGRGQYRRCPAQRIAGLRIHHGNISPLNDVLQLVDQRQIRRELSGADAADQPQQPLPPGKSVNGYDKIRPSWPHGPGGDFEIHERIVIAQQQIWRLDVLHPDLFNPVAVNQKIRK